MSGDLKVRGRQGPIPRTTLGNHGFSVLAIKEWRAAEFDAGRPSGLDDFYAAHGLCFDCDSEGVQMIGWSEPANAMESKRAAQLKLEKLPVYKTCSTCSGSGKADRSKWKKSSAPRQL
jgi:hypothetical protein